jgi:flagellar biosynthesis chaperone FliJ
MNSERRKKLGQATILLSEAQGKLEEAKSIIETAHDEETEYLDNMPEGLQSGDKGSKAQQAIDNLSEVKDAIEEFDIGDFISKIEEASE